MHMCLLIKKSDESVNVYIRVRKHMHAYTPMYNQFTHIPVPVILNLSYSLQALQMFVKNADAQTLDKLNNNFGGWGD